MKAIRSCIFAVNLTLSFLETRKKGGGRKIINYRSQSIYKIRKSQLLKGAFLNPCALKNHTLCIL